MRTLSFDCFEFDRPEAEEGLEIAIATTRDRPFPDILRFSESVWGPEAARTLPESVVFTEGLGPGNIRDYLKRYANLALPAPCDWPTYVLSADWNDWDVILAGPDTFIRYHWWTTA